MLPLKYTNGKFPTNSVLAISDLASLKGTVLDPDVETFGAEINLPCTCIDWQNREVSKMWLPPLAAIHEDDIVILNIIQSSAQSLLVAIDKFKSKDIEQAQLTQAVISYQKTAINILFGRNGMISNFFMSSRMKRSGRAVLLPRAGGDPFTCEIPEWMMTNLKIKSDEFVVVGRDPTLWEGGIEVLRVLPCKENVIRLHPLIFKQLNADCDGDTVWVLAVPRFLKKEAEAQLGSFMKRTATWPVPYSVYGKEVEWNKVQYDMGYRAAPSGFSVSPEDIFNDNGILDRVEEITNKQIKDECMRTARGLSPEEWKAITIKVNEDQLCMKIGMGPVGAAAMATRILSGGNPRNRRSASLISERLEQKLLDSKQAKSVDDQFSYRIALDILQMRNEWTEASYEEATSMLAECLGLKKPDVRPVVKLIWNNKKGLSAIVRNKYPLFASTTQTAEDFDQAVLLAEELFVRRHAEEAGFGRFVINVLTTKEEVEDAIEV